LLYRTDTMQRDKEELEKQMLETYADLQEREVLEIGCGNGRITTWLAPNAKHYTAIDPDKRSIDEARSSVNSVDFRIGSGEKLEFENNSFDVIIFTLSLHHQDSFAAIKEAHRVLREKGQLVVLEPAVDGELQQFFNIFHDEAEAQRRALEAIEAGDFDLERQEVFYTHWYFDDKEDVYAYEFDEPDTILEPWAIEKINTLLGKKANDQPIHLTDKLVILSLYKRGNEV
jgi:SAM-dependent methyltransferase